MTTAHIAARGISSELLRSCTSLAVQARIDVTAGGGRVDDQRELREALDEIRSWPGGTPPIEDPMLGALAAAALEDLSEHLTVPEHAELAFRINDALAILRA